MGQAGSNDMAVDFTVRLTEFNDGPEEALAHEIDATISLIDWDAPEPEAPIGTLKAYLFNIAGMTAQDVYFLDPYDMQEQHLADTVNQIFDFKKYEFPPRC